MSEFEPLPPPAPVHRGRRVAVTVGLVGAGLAAGAVIASAIGANAETTSGTGTSGTGTSGYGSAAPGAPGYAPPGSDGQRGGTDGFGPRMAWRTGTVTAVGSSSVTITTNGTTTKYAVNSASDIDKNGEAKLADLKVGDAVRFTTRTSSGTTTIDKLHAGDENLDRPAGMPPHGPGSSGA